MIREEDKNQRLYKKDLTEVFTEYPFFRDGMTWGEFEEEQQAYFSFYLAGGKPGDFKSLWKRRQEGEDV